MFIFLGAECEASSQRAFCSVLRPSSRDGQVVFGVNVPCYTSRSLSGDSNSFDSEIEFPVTQTEFPVLQFCMIHRLNLE